MARTALVSKTPTDRSLTNPKRDSGSAKGPCAPKAASPASKAGDAKPAEKAAGKAAEPAAVAKAGGKRPTAQRPAGKRTPVKKPLRGEFAAQKQTTDESDADNILSRADLAQCAEEWLLHNECQQRAVTTTQTRRVFLRNLLWFLERRELDACGTPELRQFFHYLRHGHEEAGGRWGNPQLTRPLRPVSIKDYHDCLRLFFEWMVAEEIVAASPLQRIERPLVREEIKQPLSREQTQALLRAAKASQDPRRNEAILLMLFDSGVRASELTALKVKDVDTRSGSFEVTGKGNKKRTCYLGKATVKALMAYLRRAKLPAGAPLFPTVRGGVYGREPLTRSGLLQLVKRLAKQAGINANVHQLRRTFATSMLEAGADICSVRDMLGHTNIQMTLKYLAVSQSHIEAQHRQFSPADRLRPGR
jgi:site-specific recombinase XerD